MQFKFKLLWDNIEWNPSGTVDKNEPAIAGDTGSVPSPKRFHKPQSN